MSKKKLAIDCANRIKYEKFEEFENSIFSEVYGKAALYTRAVVEMVGDKDSDRKKFCSQENFYNIIPFLGDRGMGKSSAMLSFALFLKEYNQRQGEIREGNYRLSDDRVGFYLLPRIDIAMLVKGENLLDIVLAGMWKAFEDSQSFEDTNETVKKGFSSVKKSYELYIDTVNGKPKQSMTSLREMKDLSRCLNLAEDFRNLVKSFLPYVLKRDSDKQFMVVVLDDLDTATQDVYAVLEQIRMFLMIPNVIVLVSADIRRLNIECIKYFMDRLYAKPGMYKQEKEQIRGYASRYLSKIFPNNKRIYMPDVKTESSGMYQIELTGKLDAINTAGSDYDIKHIVYELIYRYTGIMFAPYKEMNGILRDVSLRDIVNALDSLQEIGQLDGKPRFDGAVQWLVTRLEEYSGGVSNIETYDYMRRFLNAEGEYLNDLVTEYLTRRDVYYIDDEDEGYAVIIRLLYEAELVSGAKKMKEFLVILYSIYVRNRLLAEGSSFFGSVLQEMAARRERNKRFFRSSRIEADDKEAAKPDKDKAHIQVLDISFDGKRASFTEWYRTNQAGIYGALRNALLYDVNFWDKTAKDYKQYEIKDITVSQDLSDDDKSKRSNMELEGNFEEASIDHFFNNMVRLDKIFDGMIQNLSDAYGNSVKEGEVAGIIESNGLREKYSKWKDDNGILSVRDILPLGSVEVIYEIAKELSPANGVWGKDAQAADVIGRQIDIITSRLQNVEAYYSKLGGEVKKYSENIKSFLRLFEEGNHSDGEHTHG